MRLSHRIRKTYSYGLIFEYRRSLFEICKWLITPKKTKFKQVRKTIKAAGIDYRTKTLKNKYSEKKIFIAKKYLKNLLLIPWIEFIGITGSVSANNAKFLDDIDIFIITSKNTLWFVRPIVLLYLEIIGRRRRWKTLPQKQKNLFCTNLWLDVNNLSVPLNQRNLYTAHEVLQVKPLFDKTDVFYQFLKENRWSRKYLANAYSVTLKKTNSRDKTNKNSNPIYFLLNLFFFFLQSLIMLPHRKNEKISLGSAYFHNPDFSRKVLKKHYNKY